MDFYKANLLQIKLHRKPSRWMYFRHANASCLWFLWFEITWRRSWLPQAAYMQGWNAAFRQFHGIDESGRTQRTPDRLAVWAGGVNFYQCCLAGGGSGNHRRQVTQNRCGRLALKRGYMSKWFEIGIERMKMSDDGKVVEIMCEPDDDGNVYVEIPFDVLAKFVADQQKCAVVASSHADNA